MKTLLAALFAIALTLPGAAIGAEKRSTNPAQGDFLPAHNFKIEIDGVIQGSFSNISGLEQEVEVLEYQDDGTPLNQKRPGRVKFGNIVMKRAYLGDNNFLAEWFKKVLAGTTERKSGSIVYLDREGNEVLRYNIFEAWPCRRNILPATDPLKPKSDTYIVEELEFAVERIERAK